MCIEIQTHKMVWDILWLRWTIESYLKYWNGIDKMNTWTRGSNRMNDIKRKLNTISIHDSIHMTVICRYMTAYREQIKNDTHTYTHFTIHTIHRMRIHGRQACPSKEIQARPIEKGEKEREMDRDRCALFFLLSSPYWHIRMIFQSNHNLKFKKKRKIPIDSSFWQSWSSTSRHTYLQFFKYWIWDT